MTIVHCSGLQYTPGLTMVHQTTNMLEALLPAVVHVGTGWGWWVDTRRLLHLPRRRLQHSLCTVRPLPRTRPALA